MKFYFLKGFIKSFKSQPKSEIGLISAEKVFKEVLTDLNVTYVDPCCTSTFASVRYNKTTSKLEYLSDPELGTYTVISAL
jgi:hypothetical protein